MRVCLQRLTGWFTGAAGVELTEADEPEKARKLRKMLGLFLQVLLLPFYAHSLC